MRIEKVSKYISVTPGAAEPKTFGRRVLLSLPRVRWLEAQPDYQPWPPLPEGGSDDGDLDTESGSGSMVRGSPDYKPNRYIFRPQYRRNDLSDRQRSAWEFHCSGLTMRQIGENMGCSANAASKLVAQAREKLGIGLE